MLKIIPNKDSKVYTLINYKSKVKDIEENFGETLGILIAKSNLIDHIHRDFLGIENNIAKNISECNTFKEIYQLLEYYIKLGKLYYISRMSGLAKVRGSATQRLLLHLDEFEQLSNDISNLKKYIIEVLSSKSEFNGGVSNSYINYFEKRLSFCNNYYGVMLEVLKSISNGLNYRK